MAMSCQVTYEPAESTTGVFGGNSNWRGPIWFPVNYLKQLNRRKGRFITTTARISVRSFQSHSGKRCESDLWQVAGEISRRLIRIFLRGKDGRRPVAGGTEIFNDNPHWKDLVLFYEYFHGDNGAGIGASHQTGWTGLVAKLIEQSGE